MVEKKNLPEEDALGLSLTELPEFILKLDRGELVQDDSQKDLSQEYFEFYSQVTYNPTEKVCNEQKDKDLTGRFIFRTRTDFNPAEIPIEICGRIEEKIADRLRRTLKGEIENPSEWWIPLKNSTGTLQFQITFIPIGKPLPNEASFEEKIKELLSTLPLDDPRTRLEAVPALFKAIRKVAAQELRSAVAAVVEQAAALPYEQMVALSKVASQALDAAQLAIRNPETGFPTSLKPHRPRPTSSAQQLYLQDHRRGPKGVRQSLRVNQLPPDSIELMDAVPEIEPVRDAELPSERRRR